MGFIRGSHIPVSPGSLPHYSATPVTAKHTIRCITNEDHPFYPAEAVSAVLQGKEKLGELEMPFADLNIETSANDNIFLCHCTNQDARWIFGVDAAIGTKISTRLEGIS